MSVWLRVERVCEIWGLLLLLIVAVFLCPVYGEWLAALARRYARRRGGRKGEDR